MSQPRLLNRVRDAIRVRQYSLMTEKAYVSWIRRFILFHGKRHPDEMEKLEIEAFLTHLAVNRSVSPATQNQALQAILFLYRNVLGVELPWLDDVIRSKPQKRLPVVLSKSEVKALLDNISPGAQLPAALMYGSGLRVSECLRLRVGDLDFSRQTIRVNSGKGGKDRITVMPENLVVMLQAHLACVKNIHAKDLSLGMGEARLPAAFRRKIGKSSHHLYWQYVFPSPNVSNDPRALSLAYPSDDGQESDKKSIYSGSDSQTGHLP